MNYLRIPRRACNRPNTRISRLRRLPRNPAIRTIGALNAQMLAGNSNLIGDSEVFNRHIGRMGRPDRDRLGGGVFGFRRITFYDRNRAHHRRGMLSGRWRLADTAYGAALMGRA